MFGFVLEPDCFLPKKTDPSAVLIIGLQQSCVSKYSLNTAMHQLLTAVMLFFVCLVVFFPHVRRSSVFLFKTIMEDIRY